MNEYKRIAFDKFVEAIGTDYVKEHIKHTASSTHNSEDEVEVTFLIYEPTEPPDDKRIIIGENPVNNYFKVAISKLTKKCIRVDNQIRR